MCCFKLSPNFEVRSKCIHERCSHYSEPLCACTRSEDQSAHSTLALLFIRQQQLQSALTHLATDQFKSTGAEHPVREIYNCGIGFQKNNMFKEGLLNKYKYY